MGTFVIFNNFNKKPNQKLRNSQDLRELAILNNWSIIVFFFFSWLSRYLDGLPLNIEISGDSCIQLIVMTFFSFFFFFQLLIPSFSISVGIKRDVTCYLWLKYWISFVRCSCVVIWVRVCFIHVKFFKSRVNDAHSESHCGRDLRNQFRLSLLLCLFLRYKKKNM